MNLRGSITRLHHAAMRLISQERSTERIVSHLTKPELIALVHNNALPYKDPRIAALVWELKFYANPRAVTIGSVMLAESVLGMCEDILGTPLLTVVPTDPRHVRERGHDHTALLGSRVSELLEDAVIYRPQALRRIRDTRPQQELSRGERLQNLVGAMAADPAVAGRTCIVLDDVRTTGATCDEAARALRAAGATDVVALTLAR